MDWWRFLMKKAIISFLLLLGLTMVVCGCQADETEEQSDGLTIEEDMIYEDEINNNDSGKPYDKDDDGFVDGWY